MSHQVLISFDIDETRVQENAEKEAARQIIKEMFPTYTYKNEMSMYVRGCIENSLNR